MPLAIVALQVLREEIIAGDFPFQVFLVSISEPIFNEFLARIYLEERMDVVLCLYGQICS